MTATFDAFDSTIAPTDEMYLNALSGLKNPGLARAVYMRQGMEINQTMQDLLDWRFGPDKRSAKLLDFASGFGRSTRFLVAQFPSENVWVSDIYRDAVDFQRRQFGVNGFYSTTDPDQLVCDLRFDLIFVSSLFTHLPESRFVGWLRRLLDLLAPDGLLAFSVHDEALALGRTLPDSGILFVSASESATLSKDEYGSTYVTEAFVRRMLNAAVGGDLPCRRLPQALCGAHDLYLVGGGAVSPDLHHRPGRSVTSTGSTCRTGANCRSAAGQRRMPQRAPSGTWRSGSAAWSSRRNARIRPATTCPARWGMSGTRFLAGHAFIRCRMTSTVIPSSRCGPSRMRAGRRFFIWRPCLLRPF